LDLAVADVLEHAVIRRTLGHHSVLHDGGLVVVHVLDPVPALGLALFDEVFTLAVDAQLDHVFVDRHAKVHRCH